MRVMTTPRSVDLEITDRCNLHCTYCSHFGSAAEVGRDLPTEEWLRFFDELGRCGVMDVCFQGGEPLIREDIRDLIDGVVRNRMRFSILSNGTLISDELAAFVAATGRCSTVQVSIDGSIPIVHDSFRGKGSFARAMEGLRQLRAHGVPTTVRVTIHRKNVHDLDDVARLLLEEVGLPSFSTNCASHMGLCRKNADQVELTAEEHSIAMESLLRLNAQYGGRISAQAGPLANARMWLAMEQARRDGLDSLPGRGKLMSCGAPFSKLAVLADGTIVPCSQLGHLQIGRINRDDFREVWQSHPELVKLRERRDISLEEFEFCRGCVYLRYCTGGCPALSYTTTGDAYHPSADACLRRFLEAGGRLPQPVDPAGTAAPRS